MGVWEREGVYLVLLSVVLETEERRNEHDVTCSHTLQYGCMQYLMWGVCGRARERRKWCDISLKGIQKQYDISKPSEVVILYT